MDSNSAQHGSTTIPSELNWPPPRRVRSSPAGVRSAFFAAAVVVLALAGSSLLCMKGAHQFQNRAALRNEGIEATAHVTGFSHAGKHGGILVVNYSFVINEISFTGKADVPKVLEQDIQQSPTLPIRYLPANPTVNQPVAWDQPPISSWLMLLLPMLPVTIGILMLLSDRRERRLLAEGLPAIATITKSYLLSKGGYQSNYEFRTENGSVETGTNSFVGPPEIGTSFCVVYLPQNPKRNLPYPLQDYRLDQ